MGARYAAVDLGASSGRVITGELSGGLLTIEETHRFHNGPVNSGDSLFWDIDGLFKEIKAGLRKAAAAGPLAGVAIDTWGVDYVLLKQDGRFARPPYHYRDSRTDGVPEEVYAKIPATDIYRMTGIQHMALNTLYQLVAHRKRHPADFDNATLLPIPDALAYLLCGDISCEYTIASTTQLLDPHTRQWHDGLIAALGLPRAIFPNVCQPCGKAIPVRKEVGDEIGCPGLPVYKVGSHDTASAVASVPASKDSSWMYLSSGTWSLLGVERDTPMVTDEAGAAGFTNEGGVGGKIRFLGNIMGLWLIQECRRIWNESGKNYSFVEIQEMALAEPSGRFIVNADSKRFFAPSNMPAEIRKACAESGQGEPLGDAQIARCVFDSLAVKYRLKAESLVKLIGRQFDRLHVVGGGSQNNLLNRATADCLGLPVLAGPTEATAIGNIISQAMAAGELHSLDRARELVGRSFPIKEFLPDPAAKPLWDAACAKAASLP